MKDIILNKNNKHIGNTPIKRENRHKLYQIYAC